MIDKSISSHILFNLSINKQNLNAKLILGVESLYTKLHTVMIRKGISSHILFNLSINKQ